jgi:hypothetical protein
MAGFEMQFGKADKKNAIPPRYTETTARKTYTCEVGCGSPIEIGDRYRRSKRSDQVSCIDCWEKRWPTT